MKIRVYVQGSFLSAYAAGNQGLCGHQKADYTG